MKTYRVEQTLTFFVQAESEEEALKLAGTDEADTTDWEVTEVDY